jgi:hypothetical protein
MHVDFQHVPSRGNQPHQQDHLDPDQVLLGIDLERFNQLQTEHHQHDPGEGLQGHLLDLLDGIGGGRELPRPRDQEENQRAQDELRVMRKV